MGKKVLSMMLVLMLLVTFAACGGQTKEDTGKEQQAASTQTQDEQKEPAVEEKGDPFGKIEPMIELTAVRVAAPEQTVKYTDGDSEDNNVWTRSYQEDLGIKLKYMWTTADDTQYTQKLNLLIASGDLPDVFLANKAQFKQLVDADQVAELTSVYEKYISPNASSIITGSGPEPLNMAKVNGRLMGVPWTTLFKENVILLYIRADWMEKLNLPEPKNMEDVLKISEAFTNQDPDGNSEKDTYGFVIEKTLSSLTGFFNGYHSYPGMWIKDESGSSLVYGDIQPETRKALLKLQELYKAGQLDKEFATKDIVKAFEGVTSGKVGMMYGPFSYGVWPLQDAKNLDPNVEYNYYPLPSVDSQPAAPSFSLNGVLGYWVVRKGVSNPEAVIKMLNLFIERMYYGDDDSKKQYVTGSEGETWQCALVKAYPDWNNQKAWKQVVDYEAGKLKDTEFTYKEFYESTLKSNDIANWGLKNVYGANGTLKVIDYYKNNDLFKMDEYYGPPTEEMIEKSGNLLTLTNEVFTKIIMGAPIEEFDTYVEEWKKQGGDIFIAQVNEWYAGLNSTK